jgi:hypothetical protein
MPEAMFGEHANRLFPETTNLLLLEAKRPKPTNSL